MTRRLRLFLLQSGLLMLLLIGLFIWGEGAADRARAGRLAEGRRVAMRLGLTDLALWTEARYTRHPAMADRFSPFQNSPAGLDHFPAGSLLAPPPHLRFPGGG